MGKRALIIFLVVLFSVILVWSVYAGARASFRIGSLVADVRVTGLGRVDTTNGLLIEVEANLSGTVLCAGAENEFVSGIVVTDSTSTPSFRGRGRADAQFQFDDNEINALLGSGVCSGGTIVKLRIEAFTATVTATEITGAALMASGGEHHDHEGHVVASTDYACTVNYNKRPDREGLIVADCVITSETSS